MVNPATTAGANGDGSNSLAKESKVGIAWTWFLTVLGTGGVAWLTNLDTSHWTGWWAGVAISTVAAVIGVVSAYLKKNR